MPKRSITTNDTDGLVSFDFGCTARLVARPGTFEFLSQGGEQIAAIPYRDLKDSIVRSVEAGSSDVSDLLQLAEDFIYLGMGLRAGARQFLWE